MSALVWLKNHPKILACLCVLFAGAFGYMGGRYAQPAKVETHEVVRTEVKLQDRIVYKEAKERIVYRDVVRTVTVEREPNGATKTTTTVTDKSKDATEVRKDATETATRDSVSLEDRTKVVTYKRPDWRLSALVGTQLARPDLTKPVTLQLSYGLHAERRIWGPLYGGVWILGGGDVHVWLIGASLGMEF